MSARSPRRGLRILVATVLLIAIGGLFAVLSAQLIAVHRGEAQRASNERAALPYVAVISQLVTDLVEARSAAIRGQADAPASLRVSMAAVADLQARFGAELLTEQRWADLRSGIDNVLTQSPTGLAAVDPYADLIAMAIDLLGTALTTSHLDTDAQPAGRSLVVAVRQSMALVTATGQAADISALTASRDPDDVTEEQLALAMALRDGSSAYVDLTSALTAAAATTSSSPFTSTVAEQLTAFEDALRAALGPSAVRPPTSADPATLDAVARQVRELVRATTPTLLDELGRQLASREAAARDRMLIAIGTAAAGFVLGMVVLWWSAAPPAPVPEGGLEALDSGPDVASVSVNLPAMDARELLALEELVHVGRGVRGRPSGGADDAE